MAKRENMQALVWDGEVRLETRPVPAPPPGESLIRVKAAGVCGTDLEICAGYMAFRGILGHEFVGTVVESGTPGLAGKRVVGEINCGCGSCEYCRAGMRGHCPSRTVLGILGREGAFAEYLVLPDDNLHELPSSVSDLEGVFVEPLAAAFEVTEQVQISKGEKAAVIGDGRLGQLVAQVMKLAGAEVTCIGNHRSKLAILDSLGIRTALSGGLSSERFDKVIDCSGSASGLDNAIALVRPRGTIVLKSTVATKASLNLAPLVINEITVVGSRCGPFPKAITALAEKRISVKPLISAVTPLSSGLEALEKAQSSEAIKLILTMPASVA